MLILGERALIEAASKDELISVIEGAMVTAEGNEFSLLYTTVSINNSDLLMLLPCVTRNAWGCKLLTMRPDNPKKGLPLIDGVVAMFDGQTGAPTALLEGKSFTALRTGAVGGAGLKNIAPQDITSLGVIGAGIQGYWQAQFGCAARKGIKEVWVYDHTERKLPTFVERLSAAIPQATVKIAKNTVEVLENTQAVIAATTTKLPLFPNDEKLLAGHAFVGIGSYLPDMREFPDALFKLTGGDVYIDTPSALEETGDLITPIANGVLKRENVHTLGELISGKCKKESTTTLFKSVGMALFDVVAGAYVCEAATRKGIGQKVDF